MGGTVYGFVNNPSNTYQLTSQVKPLEDYYAKPLYLYSENLNAESEVYRNLYSVVQKIDNACPDGETCDVGIPVKTCSDNFIIIREKSEVIVAQQDGCVFIEGPAEALTKIADGFLLKIIGIQ